MTIIKWFQPKYPFGNHLVSISAPFIHQTSHLIGKSQKEALNLQSLVGLQLPVQAIDENDTSENETISLLCHFTTMIKLLKFDLFEL